MVFVPLTVAPCYRPWRLAGISHLLMASDSVEAVKEILAQKKQRLAALPTPRGVPSQPAMKAGAEGSSSEQFFERATGQSTSVPRVQDASVSRVQDDSIARQPIAKAVLFQTEKAPQAEVEKIFQTQAEKIPQAQIEKNSQAQAEKNFQVQAEKNFQAQSEKAPHAQSEKNSQAQDTSLAQKASQEALKAQGIVKTDYAQWPLPWQERLTASAKQPLVVWSYAALKEDFSGNGDAARSELVRRLYSEMALQKGSHVLWPLQLASDSSPRPDIFCSSLDILRPRLLVLLYDQVPDGLGMAQLACYQLVCPVALSGLPVLLGPSMENLVAGKAPLEPLLQMVRSILAPFSPASPASPASPVSPVSPVS